MERALRKAGIDVHSAKTLTKRRFHVFLAEVMKMQFEHYEERERLHKDVAILMNQLMEARADLARMRNELVRRGAAVIHASNERERN